VEITDEDLESLPLPSKRTIELVQFVKSDEIDPAYYQKTYFLEPEETGVKPYALLLQAMKTSKHIGLAKVAIRTKEQLCVLRPVEGAIILEALHWPDEVRLEEAPNIPAAAANKRELEMAEGLIKALAAPFKPEEFQDNYREALLELIEAKTKGHEVVREPASEGTPMPDLMAALRASLAAAGSAHAPAARQARGRSSGDKKEAPKKKAAPRKKAA
jgi:DNA end-binding protein Ku